MLTVEELIKYEEKINSINKNKQKQLNNIENSDELFYFNFSSISFLVLFLFLSVLNIFLLTELNQDTMVVYKKVILFFSSYSPFLFVFLQKPIQDSITKYKQKSFKNTIIILMDIFVSFLTISAISAVLFFISLFVINNLTGYQSSMLLITATKSSIFMNLVASFWIFYKFSKSKKDSFYIKTYKKENIELNNESIQKRIHKMKLKKYDISRKIINSINNIDEYDYFKVLVEENNLTNINNISNKIEEKLLKDSPFE